MKPYRYWLMTLSFVLSMYTSIVYAGSCDKRALLNDVLDTWVSKSNIPSVALQVEDQFGVMYAGVKGQISLTDSTPATKEAYFRTASVAKLLTAATVLKLVEEGMLDLEDTLEQHLSLSLVDRLHVYQGTNYGSSITIQQLLSHTTGLPDTTDHPSFIFDLQSNPEQVRSPEALLEYAIALTPSFPPGSRQGYASTNYMILGLIIEAAMGKAYHQVVREQVLEPLGLHHTFDEAHEKPENIEILHSYVDSYDINQVHPSFEFADGGFITTTGDLVQLGLALNNGKLFKDQSLWDLMLTPNGSLSIGLGASVIMKDGEPVAFYHPGFWNTYLYVDIKQQRAVAYTLNQSSTGSGFFSQVLNIINQAEPSYKDGVLNIPCLNVETSPDQSVSYEVTLQLKSSAPTATFSLSSAVKK